MQLLNAPHIFNYAKIDDCRLPEGRVSIPFGFQLTNPNEQIVPIPFPVTSFQGDYFLLDLATISNGVKPLSGIKSLELDIVFTAGISGGQPTGFSSLFIFVQDSQQLFSLIPTYRKMGANLVIQSCNMHCVLPIISNAPSKIWFIQNGVDFGAADGSFVNVFGNANNFEKTPYSIESSNL